MDVLGALVEKSILKRQLRGSRPPRYWLLDTLRQYGRERLREFGQETTMQKRHFDWICGLAESVGAWDSRQPELFTRMASERDNLWTALDFCRRHAGEVEAGSKAAQHLMAFWACRGPFGDVRRILTSLAELAPEDSVPRGRLLWVAAVMATSQNDFDACASLSDESLRIGTETQDAEVVAWSLLLGAMPRWVEGDIAAATRQFESALSLARLMHAEQAELQVLNTLCGISIAGGDLDRAAELGEQALTMSQDRGEVWVRGFVLTFLAQANWLRGDKQRAEALAREAAVCKRAVDDRNSLTIALGTLAWIAAEGGRHERAAILLGAAERVRDESSLTLLEVFRPQHERTVSLVVQGIGQAAFAAPFAQGRAMTIDDGVAFGTADRPPPKPAPAGQPEPPSLLTRRQLDIARLIADDLSNKQIAARLFLSERTVETHVTNILNKLGLNSRIQISRWMADLNGPGPTATEERP